MYLYFSLSSAVLSIDVQFGIHAAKHSKYRVYNVIDQGCDYAGKRTTYDDTNCHIHDIFSADKLFELIKKVFITSILFLLSSFDNLNLF